MAMVRRPRRWPLHVKAGILHAISLASAAIVVAHGTIDGCRRLAARLDQATQEIALLREELDITDGRRMRSKSRRRPHYSPNQRLRILQLRAAVPSALPQRWPFGWWVAIVPQTRWVCRVSLAAHIRGDAGCSRSGDREARIPAALHRHRQGLAVQVSVAGGVSDARSGLDSANSVNPAASRSPNGSSAR